VIEFIVIYFVGRRHGRIAREKGRSPTVWFVATAGVWLGLQLSVAIAGLLILSLIYGLEAEFSRLSEFLVVYFPSLLVAAAGVLALNRRLLSLPCNSGETVA
jgi:hypothetical protein